MSTTTEPRTTLAIRLPVSLKAEVGAPARATGRNLNAMVEEAIQHLIAVEQWQIADMKAVSARRRLVTSSRPRRWTS